MLEREFFAWLSIVFMMGAVMIFDRVQWRHKHGWQIANLMTQDESQRILRILAAWRDQSDQE